MDKKTIAAIAIPTILSLNLFMENRKLNFTLGEIDRGYMDFVSKKVKDPKTGERFQIKDRIVRGSVGVFGIGSNMIICARYESY